MRRGEDYFRFIIKEIRAERRKRLINKSLKMGAFGGFGTPLYAKIALYFLLMLQKNVLRLQIQIS